MIIAKGFENKEDLESYVTEFKNLVDEGSALDFNVKKLRLDEKDLMAKLENLRKKFSIEKENLEEQLEEMNKIIGEKNQLLEVITKKLDEFAEKGKILGDK